MESVPCQWLLYLGLALQLFGTGLALSALVETFNAYKGGKSFWDPVSSRLRYLLGPLFWHSEPQDEVRSAEDEFQVSQYARVPTQAPLEEQVEHLDTQFQIMVNELNALRQDVIGDRQYVKSALGDVAAHAHERVTNLAVGTIHRQMFGLFLIGAGTVCSAIPSAWGCP